MNVVLSVAAFPPLPWLSAVAKAKKSFIERHENFCKQSYRNRYEIYSANGKLALSIPIVKNHGLKTPVSEVMIDYSVPWQRIHLHALRSAYGKTPYFIHYMDEVEEVISEGIPLLWDFNMRTIAMACRWLKITVPQNTEDYIRNYENAVDLRDLLHPKKKFDVPMPGYFQPFSPRYGFIAGLSVLDLMFNMGPDAPEYL